MIKKLLWITLGVTVTYLIYHHKSVLYGLEQARGQARVLWNAQEIDRLMNDADFPDSTKAKFIYIEEVKKFAENKLGLEQSQNYSTYFDQKGKPILWVVTASPEFEIKAYQWSFPIAGNFSYKGFFDYQKAEEEAAKMKSKGYDTEIDEVNAWSTLGWFKDPILSSMLQRSEGSLAELIIHELTHATIYLKDRVEFNENLASFFGREGAKLFLEHQFGPNSMELNAYTKGREKKAFFRTFIMDAKVRLDSLYKTFQPEMEVQTKRELKSQLIADIKSKLIKSSYYSDQEEAQKRLEKFKPNNAYFSGISTYHAKRDELENMLEQEFNGNLKAMIEYFKSNSASL